MLSFSSFRVDASLCLKVLYWCSSMMFSSAPLSGFVRTLHSPSRTWTVLLQCPTLRTLVKCDAKYSASELVSESESSSLACLTFFLCVCVSGLHSRCAGMQQKNDFWFHIFGRFSQMLGSQSSLPRRCRFAQCPQGIISCFSKRSSLRLPPASLLFLFRGPRSVDPTLCWLLRESSNKVVDFLFLAVSHIF